MPEGKQDAALSRYRELLRLRAPHERLAQAVALTRAARTMAIAGIRLRNPSASEREIRNLLAVRLYGPEAARRMFGALPPDVR